MLPKSSRKMLPLCPTERMDFLLPESEEESSKGGAKDNAADSTRPSPSCTTLHAAAMTQYGARGGTYSPTSSGATISIASEAFDVESQKLPVCSLKTIGSAHSNVLLNERAAQQILPQQKGGMSVLCSYAMQWAMLVSFVIAFAGNHSSRSITREDGEFRYSIGSVLLTGQVINLIAGLFCMRLDGTPLRSCFDLRQIVLWVPSSVLTVADMILKFVVLQYLPPTLAALLQQTKLITVAMASACAFGRKFSSIEVASLVGIFIITLLYASDDCNPGSFSSFSSQQIRLGFLLQTVEIAVATVMAVATEFTMKNPTADRVPFSCMQVRNSIVMIPLFLLYFFTDESIKAHRELSEIATFATFFNGWTWKVGVVVLISFIAGWLGNLIQLKLDSIVRQVAGAVGIPVVFLQMLMLQPQEEIGGSSDFEIFRKVCSMVAIVIAVASYAISTRFTRKHRDLQACVNETKVSHANATRSRKTEASSTKLPPIRSKSARF